MDPFSAKKLFQLTAPADVDCDDEPVPFRHFSRSPNRHGSHSPRPGSRSPLPPEKSCRRRLETSYPKHRSSHNELQLKQKIQALEDTVADYERQKNSVMGTFHDFRERLAEKERMLEAEYSSRIITLSEEVLAAKRDFERRMKEYQDAQERYERERQSALEKLKQEHQREMQTMEKRCSDAHLINLEHKYVVEIQRLDEERKALRGEKERLSEIYESKLKRAQTLYETELTAAKALYANELNALKDHESALRDELLARQEEFKDRIDGLHLQFQQGREDLDKCKLEVAEMEERLRIKEKEVQAITRKLEAARKDTDEALERLRKVETELESTKVKYTEQEQELLKKSEMLSVLENAKTKLESLIQDLQAELKSLKNKVTFLENERQNLESQSRTQAQLQESQLHTLQMFVDNMTKEKEKLKAEFDQQLEHERMEAEERLFKVQQELSAKIAECERQQHQQHQQHQQRTTQENLVDGNHRNIEEEIRQQYISQIEELKTEVEKLREFQEQQEEIGRLKQQYDEWTGKEQAYVKEIEKLHDSLSTLSETIEVSDAVQEQLEKLRSEKECIEQALQGIQAEFEQLKLERDETSAEYQTKIVELQLQLQTKEDNLQKAEAQAQQDKQALEEERKELLEKREQLETEQKEMQAKVGTELQSKVEELEAKNDDLMNELQKRNDQLKKIRTETHEYIRKREQQQAKTHKKEIEKLQLEKQEFLERMESVETELVKVNAELEQKLSEANSGERVQELQAKVAELSQSVEEKATEIAKLQAEKVGLEVVLERERKNSISSMSSDCKKRDSISSGSSSGRNETAKHDRILHKWQCLVRQVQKANAGKTNSTTTMDSETLRSGKSTPAPGENEERGRLIKKPQTGSTGALKPPENSRQAGAKSPSRSPNPGSAGQKVKQVTLDKRPAWRI